MKKLILIILAGLFPIFLNGCATIFRDSNQTMTLNSNTDKVNLKIINKSGTTVFQGQTPTTISLKTSADGYFNPEKYTIIASKDTYHEQTIILDWHVSGWYAGNIVFGGLIGLLIVDPMTGKMYYIDELQNINMTPIDIV